MKQVQAPAAKAATGKKESAIQAECFQYHWNFYPQERSQLFMVYNNGKNAAHGNILRAMGMVKGVSDMIYLAPRIAKPWHLNGSAPAKLVFLECKRPGEKQSPEQKAFEQLVKALGHDYWVFTSLIDFMNILAMYHEEERTPTAPDGEPAQQEAHSHNAPGSVSTTNFFDALDA